MKLRNIVLAVIFTISLAAALLGAYADLQRFDEITRSLGLVIAAVGLVGLGFVAGAGILGRAGR